MKGERGKNKLIIRWQNLDSREGNTEKGEREKGLVGALVWPIFQLNCLQMVMHLSVCLYNRKPLTDTHKQICIQHPLSSLFRSLKTQTQEHTYTLPLLFCCESASHSTWSSVSQWANGAATQTTNRIPASGHIDRRIQGWRWTETERGGRFYILNVVSCWLSCELLATPSLNWCSQRS